MLMHIWLTDEFFCFVNQQDSDLLNLGTGSVSWFEVNGYGCRPTYSTNITSEDPFRLVRPEYVEDCFLNYPTIEITHSAVQLVVTDEFSPMVDTKMRWRDIPAQPVYSRAEYSMRQLFGCDNLRGKRNYTYVYAKRLTSSLLYWRSWCPIHKLCALFRAPTNFHFSAT